MLKSQIQIGKRYLAKVSGKLTTVEVLAIVPCKGYHNARTAYDVKNLTTGRSVRFRSAGRFRKEVV